MAEQEPRPDSTRCQLRHLTDRLSHAHVHDPKSPWTDEEIQQLAQECEVQRREQEAQNQEFQKVQRQLERYRDWYVDLYDFAPIGYVTLDEDGYVQEINLAGAAMLAADQDRVIGYPLVEYVRDEDRATFQEHISRCVQAREPVTSEITLTATDDRLISVQLHSIPIIDEDQETVFCKTAVTDITERKRAEEQLATFNATLELRVAQRTAEAEQRAVQLRALAAELAHAEQQERRRLAQLLHQNLQQLLVAMRLEVSDLINHPEKIDVDQKLSHFLQVLEVTIVESRSLTEELCPSILYEAGLVAGVKWLADRMQQKHGLTVETEIDPQAEPAEEGVREFLFQAVRELLLNVTQHAKADHAWVTMKPSGKSQVTIEVRDSGVGFDPTSLKNREATVGGAFGLFSIRERLEVLGGRLKVHSMPGEGTQMVMTAPRHQPQAYHPSVVSAASIEAPAPADEEHAPELAVSPPAKRPGVPRVLLADDHRIIRRGLVAMLRRRPEVRVVGEARNGEEAVRLALRIRPDIVLMDVAMPKLNGVEATRRIKAEAPEIRVIGLSMYDEGEMPAAMRDAGVEAYVSKASPAEVLIATMLASQDTATP